MPVRRRRRPRFVLQNRCSTWRMETAIAVRYLAWFRVDFHASIIHALRLPLLMFTVPVVFSGLQWPLVGGALRQQRSSDLCCCFSCFDAGPERAVRATRDGPPCPHQPGPSHRAERYVFVPGQRFSPLPVWPCSLPVCRLLPPICLWLSRQRLKAQPCACSQAPLQMLRHSPWMVCRFTEPLSRTEQNTLRVLLSGSHRVINK